MGQAEYERNFTAKLAWIQILTLAFTKYKPSWSIKFRQVVVDDKG